ncbi:MAG: hypothetical protein VX951_12375 [Planctomycetota bacterium]|nr:hypothetical protein [Planctomycetota bacterium]
MNRLLPALVGLFGLVSAVLGQTAAESAKSTSVADSLAKALDKYFSLSAPARVNFSFPPALEEVVVKDEAATRRAVWKAVQRAAKGTQLQKDFAKQQVHNGKLRSPYTIKKVGKRPAGGWPLFIAMHGGGGVPKRINDSQWNHMQIYYRDQKSVEGYKYLALRAPTDQWNGFYTGYIYPLVANLVRQFLLLGDVDPDRVFVMGYSHGGYGAFAIGPTLPDRFAAVHASAAAPTGGETQIRNLRNTIFTYMVGERDTAYGRASRCQAFARQVKSLRGDRRDIYPVTFEFMAGYGHGGLPDRDKIRSMYPAVRNPAPKDLTWDLGGGHIRDHFWLHVPAKGSNQSVAARIDGNTIYLEATGVEMVELVVDRRHLDLHKTVEIKIGDKTTGVVLRPSLRALCETMLRRGDPRLAGTVSHPVVF